LPFRALTLLLTRPGEVITREEFRQALWAPDIYVDFEQGISRAVMRLRDALGDSADNPISIQTIERRGTVGSDPYSANPRTGTLASLGSVGLFLCKDLCNRQAHVGRAPKPRQK
jgi:hypothetical protein